jgi:hypothetical protein
MVSDAVCSFTTPTRGASRTHLKANNFDCPAQQVCLTIQNTEYDIEIKYVNSEYVTLQRPSKSTILFYDTCYPIIRPLLKLLDWTVYSAL